MSSQEDINSAYNNTKDDPISAYVQLGIQYLKDLSVENTNSPHIFTLNSSKAPKLDIKYNVSAVKLGEQEDSNTSSFEVILDVKVTSKIADDKNEAEHTLFICEAKYAGVFSIENGDDERQKRSLFIYAPTVLFPFLRQVVSSSTGSSGFPPLMLDPIDFAAQYEEHSKKHKVLHK